MFGMQKFFANLDVGRFVILFVVRHSLDAYGTLFCVWSVTLNLCVFITIYVTKGGKIL